ncbi:MAG: sensor histidine kinase [Burkholderiaceae bacterium]
MDPDQQLEQLAAHFKARQRTIIDRWRGLVTTDAELSTPDSLSRAQFADHVPEILDALNVALVNGGAKSSASTVEQAQTGAGHGMHRWQQGYSQLELMREWTHLQLALIDELEEFGRQTKIDPRALHTAYRTIARFCSEAMSESTARFESMHRAEAAGQVNDLAKTLAEARLLEQKQAEILRGAAHDLRGNLGIVANAAHALQLEGVSTERRADILAMVQRALTAHTQLLSDLMDLARLQAGQEHRVSESVDVSPMLHELCELSMPTARARGLSLSCSGPPRFVVEADRLKISRIVQNLLLNALHYTPRGGVSVTWGDSRDNDPKRWMVCIEDTGPGLQQGTSAPLADALQTATEEVLDVEPKDQATPSGDISPGTGRPSAVARDPQHHGEGIGLSIVKRLCELLDSSLEMESAPGQGTVVRVVLPRQYAAATLKEGPLAAVP